MTGGGLGARRHKITLMAEETTTGAGGRAFTATPIIGDVWAEITESTTTVAASTGRETAAKSIRATCHYRAPYAEARRLRWAGGVYRITSTRHSNIGPSESLTFEATQLVGETLS